jgi:hypothetical protein
VTLTEQARLAGIQSQLATRGRTVTHVRSGLIFRALADHHPGFKARPSAEGEYAFGSEERSEDNLYAIRSDIAGAEIAVGDELTDADGRSFEWWRSKTRPTTCSSDSPWRPPVLDLSVNARDFNDAVTRYILTLGKDARGAVRQQSMLLGKKLVQFTPPRTRTQGRKAVARDINRAVTAIRPADFTSPDIRKLIRARDYAGLEAVFGRFEKGGFAGFRVLPFTAELHRSRRDRRGRVTRSARVATPDSPQVRDYIRQVQTRVGRGKGGWVAAVTRLGGSVPEWLLRHAVTGTVEDRTASLNPTVKMKNRSEWAGDVNVDRVLSGAIRSRRQDILRSIEKAADSAARTSRLRR